MKRKWIIFLLVSSLILTGFTIIDIDEYEENKPSWTWGEESNQWVYKAHEVKPKVETAIQELDNKGLKMSNVKIYISPVKYNNFYGLASLNRIIIANNSYNTIYHELAHVYAYKNKDKNIIKKYEKMMKHYYPNHVPKGTYWQRDIEEDFAEEFKKMFTGVPKRTAYPDFPNFYEWLLRNTQPIEITREEVFDKLGGTDKLIKEGIVIGNENGDYMLSKPITRGEVATVLVRLKGYNKEKQVPFTDINNQWYSSYVKKIYNEGFIKGLPNNTFAGDKLITRYELHMILERLE